MLLIRLVNKGWEMQYYFTIGLFSFLSLGCYDSVCGSGMAI